MVSNMKKYIWTLAYAFLSVPRVFANAVVPGSGNSAITVKLDNPLGSTTIYQFLEKVLGLMVNIGFPVLILAIVYTGFLFVKAQGNESELGKAKQAFFYTIIGGVILLGAEIIVRAISGTISQL
jgi:hypothetical protein